MKFLLNFYTVVLIAIIIASANTLALAGNSTKDLFNKIKDVTESCNNVNINLEVTSSNYVFDWAEVENGVPDVEMVKSLSSYPTTASTTALCAGSNFTVTHGSTSCCDGLAYIRYYNGYTGVWTTAAYGDDIRYSTINNASPGTYTFYTELYWRDAGYRGQTSTTVTVDAYPTTTTVTGAGTFCGSATLTATGGTGGTIYWQNTNSDGISTVTPSTSQTVTSSGIYYFRAMSANASCWGTQGSAAVTIDIPPTAPTSITVSPAGTTICPSETRTLSATGGSTGTNSNYEWYSGDCGTGTFLGYGASLLNVNAGAGTTTNYYVRRVGTSSACTSPTGCASPITITVGTESVVPSSINAVANP